MPRRPSHEGTSLKTYFTIFARPELGCRMIPLLAAAIAASSPQSASPASTGAVVQARATVRIVSAARLDWRKERQSADIPPARMTTIQTNDGPQPAKLIEFE